MVGLESAFSAAFAFITSLIYIKRLFSLGLIFYFFFSYKLLIFTLRPLITPLALANLVFYLLIDLLIFLNSSLIARFI
jgi:hypothetical protein